MSKKARLPKLILSDIDGVWTDGGMYYGTDGTEWKKFNTYDSAGVLFCKLAGIPVGIITGEDIEVVHRRAEKLKLDYAFFGVKNKVAVVQSIIEELAIEWEDVAYLGDDLNDVEVLKKVGISGVVNNAPDYIKELASLITKKNGGEGAFREFVEEIFSENNMLKELIEEFHVKNKKHIQ